MIDALLIVLGIVMVISAVFALYQKSLVAAIISAGVVSLLASIVFLVLAAPDVAMTEAAIGSALTTVVFLLALNRIRLTRSGGHGAEAGRATGAATETATGTDGPAGEGTDS